MMDVRLPTGLLGGIGPWVNRLLRGTLMDVTMIAEFEQAHEAATHDAFTGLPNRAWLVDELDRRMRRSRQRVGDYFAVHFIDFDGFKLVNDTYGQYMVGDEVLGRAPPSAERQQARRIGGPLRRGRVRHDPGTARSPVTPAGGARRPYPDPAVAGDVVMPGRSAGGGRHEHRGGDLRRRGHQRVRPDLAAGRHRPVRGQARRQRDQGHRAAH